MSDKPTKNATEYAENLSHELLTPLAIIRSKAEVYADRTSVNLKDVCEEALENYEDQIRSKSLQIRFKVESELVISSNKTLIDILINNLLKNAVTHNLKNGELLVKISSGSVEIKNTFDLNFPPPKNQFKRFTTSKGESGSIGLGLSIVKRIAKFLELELQVDINERNYSTIVSF